MQPIAILTIYASTLAIIAAILIAVAVLLCSDKARSALSGMFDASETTHDGVVVRQQVAWRSSPIIYTSADPIIDAARAVQTDLDEALRLWTIDDTTEAKAHVINARTILREVLPTTDNTLQRRRR